MSIRIVQIEIAAEINPIRDLTGVQQLWLLVRLRGRPLGWLTFDTPPPEIGVEQLRNEISERFWSVIWREVFHEHVTGQAALFQPNGLGDWLAAPTPAPGFPAAPSKLTTVSVVVCTRDRADSLLRTLESLQRLDYPSFEVIIVDNCPTTQATRDLVARYPFRYILEPRPGLDWARNRGIVEAHGDIIAFTDDDVCVDPGWLRGLVAGFIASDVLCVTGMVLPGELETTAQKLFEVHYGGMNKGFQQRIFDPAIKQPYMPYLASRCGVGANMAFHRELFDRIGKFDEALDVGTASGGGGDLDMFYRVLQAGYRLVYEPTAIVYHYHRRDYAALRRQIYQNGTAISAYFIKCIRSQPGGGWPALRFALGWIWEWYIKRLLRSLRREGPIPRELVFAEVCGLLRGPWLYRQAMCEAQALVRQQEAPLCFSQNNQHSPGNVCSPEPAAEEERCRY